MFVMMPNGLDATQATLKNALQEFALAPELIERVLDSGYFLRTSGNPFNGTTWTTVSDMMYGAKQFSSSFPIDEFVQYVKGEFTFPELPPFTVLSAKSIDEIRTILADSCRTHYIEDGTFSYRGQPRGYTFKRQIPNPVRANADGQEISVTAGVYRQTSELYSFKTPPIERRSFRRFLRHLEPNNPDAWVDSEHAYDIMRTEQHYATQTAGLDLSFEIETAIFFATHKMKWDKRGRAYYEKVKRGGHEGVIYCFRFTNPTVRQTQYLIREFDFFRTYPPERILRQTCALPLFGQDERNIAITDLNCIIHLDPDFEYETPLTPEYMFPNAKEDRFYDKLLQLKDEFPEYLEKVVEYQWAR